MAIHRHNRPTTASPTDPLVAQAEQTIQRHQMLTPGDKVLVGVSGGPDSMALVHVLHALASRLDIRLGMAHLDHGLRPATAEQEAALVLALARRLGLDCQTGKIEALARRGSLEEQLRLHRYAFFQETAAMHGCNKIALGHHADDNAEAVLMHLLRGSGIRGLAGIPPVRGQGIIRPLIAARRADILAYLERHDIAAAQDATNADLRFERNQIRHQLLPLLEQRFNPNLVQALNRTAMLCWEEEHWLVAHLTPYAAQATVSENADGLELSVETLSAWPRPVQRHVLRMALRQWQGHLRRLGAEHIEALIGLLAAGKSGRRLHLPIKVIAERDLQVLRFRRVAQPRHSQAIDPPAQYHYALPWPLELPLAMEIPEADCRLHFSAIPVPAPEALRVRDPCEIFLDPDQLSFPLSVRNFRPGDRFQPFGLHGTQKLKALLINRKIPKNQRERFPLLLSGDTIVWVVGLRRSSAAPVSPTAAHVLRVATTTLNGTSQSAAAET
ncbi:MAG: tRNA lysidine(34) synthetase TilS [Desulfatitalea sp.]